MKLRPLVVLAIVALVWLTGCATVSFKRGAGPGTAKADEDACRATTASPEDYADCLRKHGWMVSTPGVAAEPAREAAPTAAGAPAQPAPADAGLTPPATPPAKAAPHAAPPPGTTESAKPAAAKAGGGATAPATPPETVPAAKTTTPTATAPPAAKPLDPMAKVTVSSWWKMGGTNAELDAAVKACVDELGPAHQPNVGPTEVTVALRDCLREKKWFAVGGTGGIGAARFTR